MFENSIRLPKPIKFVHWIEPELSLAGQSKDRDETAGSSVITKALIMNEDLRLRSKEIALKEAENQLREKAIQLLKKIDHAVAAHFEGVENILARYERKITSLSFAIAQKILSAEIKLDPDVVTRTVQKALNSVNEEARIEIQVNPSDKEAIEKYWTELVAAKASNGKWTLEANSSIGKGGCIIKTPSGAIDARIESQLTLIESIIDENLNSWQEIQNAT